MALFGKKKAPKIKVPKEKVDPIFANFMKFEEESIKEANELINNNNEYIKEYPQSKKIASHGTLYRLFKEAVRYANAKVLNDTYTRIKAEMMKIDVLLRRGKLSPERHEVLYANYRQYYEKNAKKIDAVLKNARKELKDCDKKIKEILLEFVERSKDTLPHGKAEARKYGKAFLKYLRNIMRSGRVSKKDYEMLWKIESTVLKREREWVNFMTAP